MQERFLQSLMVEPSLPNCEVGAVWGRGAVAVAARCSRLQAVATLLMQDGVISGV